jgi:adenine-specific DNA-methyltransferase
MFPNIETFVTPKPEGLLQRIIHIASDPGDIVIDFFAGSGTTAAVAHKMNRRWIAVERSLSTTISFTVPRLLKVLLGTDPGGITESADWRGGGTFWVATVGPTGGLETQIRAALRDTTSTQPPTIGLTARTPVAKGDVAIPLTLFDDQLPHDDVA